MGTLVDLQKRPMPDDPELAGHPGPWAVRAARSDPVWLDRLLLWAADHDVSDVTIPGEQFRVRRTLRPVGPSRAGAGAPPETTVARRRSTATTRPVNWPGRDIDCSMKSRRGARIWRGFGCMTAARAVREWGLEITIRTIPTTPPTLDQLDLPAVYARIWPSSRPGHRHRTDRVGQDHCSARSSALGAARFPPQDHRLASRPSSTSTTPCPAARAHRQHEIGVHLQSFAAGVRNSLRRKPMVILVGESRDADTIDAMILAAQTGHLVYPPRIPTVCRRP